MDERPNDDLDPRVFEEARKRVEAALPYKGIRVGFYTHDLPGASVFGGFAKKAKAALMTIKEGSVRLRIYREPDEKARAAGVHFKTDERLDINKERIKVLRGSEFPGHHIRRGIVEDMIEQNNVSVKVVPDGAGNLVPKIGPDGMMEEAYINFPEVTPEEMLKQARTFKKNNLENEQTT